MARPSRTRPSTAYAAVYLRDPKATWPLDIGDDPAFGASWRFARAGGVLSWGVCRPDLRKLVRPGDLIVFFAADRVKDHLPARYIFVGYATVDRLVTPQAVWEEDELAVYRRYLNQLILPCGDGRYEHHEPTARKEWHPNWLWRTTHTLGVQTSDLAPLEQTQVWAPGMTVKGRLLVFAPIYVLFAAEGQGTFVAADPPLVGEAATSSGSEVWLDDPFASKLRQLVVLRSATRRTWLRSNNQMPHRHMKLTVPPNQLRNELQTLCQSHGVLSRT